LGAPPYWQVNRLVSDLIAPPTRAVGAAAGWRLMRLP
jgi:hypothetical protein